MKITLEPTIDIDDIQGEMGTADFPFVQGAENGSYVNVGIDESSLTFYRMDIDFWEANNNPFEKQRATNMRDFIMKMNDLGYHSHILVYIHW